MIWYVGVFWIALVILCVAAVRWGEWPERSVALLYLSAAGASAALRPALDVKFHVLDLSLLAIDTALLCGLLLIALRADRWWPMIAAAMQMIATLSHVAKLVDVRIYGLGYQLMEESSAYPTLALLALGIWRVRARRMRGIATA